MPDKITRLKRRVADAERKVAEVILNGGVTLRGQFVECSVHHRTKIMEQRRKLLSRALGGSHG